MTRLALPAPARTLNLWLERAAALFAKPNATRDVTPGTLPHLTGRQARDIGLSETETETEKLRLQWPSVNGPRHPML